eukprot:gene1332-5200_t
MSFLPKPKAKKPTKAEKASKTLKAKFAKGKEPERVTLRNLFDAIDNMDRKEKDQFLKDNWSKLDHTIDPKVILPRMAKQLETGVRLDRKKH